ncbi:uncharacterized protein LOC112051825 [Bicyclus anynana]|uniref:Uncharacterized protein LOC112051825 n=1 Tax=Bicyclus anynana TaxID=110368 RepID=A0ABM3M624_BICAN|nr:uncharacterized protein LOC112051825 [Bicyclus anynana]XP_052746932.1 uncharacterized protein LOC112051825 [Bicyclus anynana]
MYIKNSLYFNVTEIQLTHASCLQLTINNNILILGIYRSPSNNNADCFIQSLNLHLEKIKSYKNITVTGDININTIPKSLENTNERNNRISYLNMITHHGLLPGHSFPTRQDNCLDHILLKLEKSKHSAFIAVLNTTITDHLMVLLCLSNDDRRCPKMKTITDYNEALQNFANKNLYTLLSNNKPELLIEKLTNEIKDSLDKNTRTILLPKNKRVIKPWIAPGILRCIRHRNKLQKRVRHNPSDENLKNVYKRYRNFCYNLIILFLSVLGNPWPKIFFKIKMQQLSSTQVTTSYTHYSSFGLLDTDVKEVSAILMSLKTSSASGWDNIPTEFLKLANNLITPIIVHLANLCFSTGIFPSLLKKSVITPVHKCGNRDDVSNYRPISVLPAISKIIEKIINNRLLSYLEQRTILSKSQFGFRRGKSTEDAVTNLTTLIIEKLDTNKKCLTVFLDLKKAFDTVSVPILLHKLESIGMRDTTLSLFQSYLSGRTQMVKIDKYISNELNINYGVPQGSVLGPTLFLVYINELCNLKIRNGHIFSYADDTAIVFTDNSWEDVRYHAEKGLRNIARWLNSNLLTLNT